MGSLFLGVLCADNLIHRHMTKHTTSARNTETGERRDVTIHITDLIQASDDGIDRCTGPCECRVEPDGICPNGWPSRMLVAGVI